MDTIDSVIVYVAFTIMKYVPAVVELASVCAIALIGMLAIVACGMWRK